MAFLQTSTSSLGRMWLLLIVLCVLVRVPLWFGYTPLAGGDTATYQRMAEHLSSWDFAGYVGKRPPGYPMFLLLCQSNERIAWAAQSILGILTALMIFSLALRRGVRPMISFLAALATTLSLNLLLFEAALLTETLSTFLLVLVFWLWDLALIQPRARSAIPWLLASGVVIGLDALVKPFLQFLVVLIPLLTACEIWRRGRSWKTSLVGAAIVAGPALALVLGWSSFNKAQIDYFGVSTLAGYNLTQHSGAIMEFAPKEYATVRDIYIKYREAHRQVTGSHSMTIWEAYPEMMKATGQSFVQLSKTLAELSTRLLISHPYSYAKTAFTAWLQFWKAPLAPAFLDVEGASPSLIEVLRIVWLPERYLLVGAKALFLFVAAGASVRLLRQRRAPDPLDVAVFTTILAASFLQALTEYGENARYSIPFQSLIFLALFAMVREPRCSARVR